MMTQSVDSGRETKRRSPLGRMLAALVIAGGAQYALTHGFPELGGVGYGVAVWLFVSSAGGYLEHDLHDDEAERADAIVSGRARGAASRLTFIMNNWRRMTLSELLSGASVLQEVEKSTADKTPPAQGDWKRERLAVIMQNWRGMTISQIVKILSRPPDDEDETT